MSRRRMLVGVVACVLAAPALAAPMAPAGAMPRLAAVADPADGSSLIVRFRGPVTAAGAQAVAADHGA
ncbi:MAG: hypothetical protein ACRDZ3_17495, partial [Acidimicrobiia bacterium]